MNIRLNNIQLDKNSEDDAPNRHIQTPILNVSEMQSAPKSSRGHNQDIVDKKIPEDTELPQTQTDSVPAHYNIFSKPC